MNKAIIINDIDVKLEVADNQIWTTSLQIADVFEKQHKNILAKIEELPQDEFRQLNFKPSSEVRKNGVFDKDTKYYKISKDGLTLLAMSFNGEAPYSLNL